MDMAESKLRRQFFGLPVAPSRQHAEHKRLIDAWQTAKRIVLMCLLAGAFMFYYMLDTINQALIAF